MSLPLSAWAEVDRRAQPEIDALAAMARLEIVRDRRRGGAGHRAGRRLDHRHRAAAPARRRRHLQADDAAAHDGHLAAGREYSARGARARHRGRVGSATPGVRATSSSGQGAHPRAGGQHQPGVSDAIAAAERDLAPRPVDRDHRFAQPQVDVQRRQHVAGREADGVLMSLRLQHRLGERRAVVGRVPLVAHQQHPADKPRAAQPLGDPQARQPGPDDHHRGQSFCIQYAVPGGVNGLHPSRGVSVGRMEAFRAGPPAPAAPRQHRPRPFPFLCISHTVCGDIEPPQIIRLLSANAGTQAGRGCRSAAIACGHGPQAAGGVRFNPEDTEEARRSRRARRRRASQSLSAIQGCSAADPQRRASVVLRASSVLHAGGALMTVGGWAGRFSRGSWRS